MMAAPHVSGLRRVLLYSLAVRSGLQLDPLISHKESVQRWMNRCSWNVWALKKKKKKLECCLNNDCAADPFQTHKYFFIKAPLRSLYTWQKKKKWLHHAINWVIALMHPFDVSVLLPRNHSSSFSEGAGRGPAVEGGGFCLLLVYRYNKYCLCLWHCPHEDSVKLVLAAATEKKKKNAQKSFV